MNVKWMVKIFVCVFVSGLCGIFTMAILEVLGYLACIYIFKSVAAAQIIVWVIVPGAITLGFFISKQITEKILLS